ncbi:hypothetical protein [Bacteroides acidifaciens]|uniref:hypothetical protein n=1 Tax=Bacteroidales TaxID=171549 RepID=UPI0025AE0D3E|nr:hypothetical protein [Bacteroides acidifaciens]
MKKEIPEIDTLLDGINDPDAVLNPSPTKEEAPNDILPQEAATSLENTNFSPEHQPSEELSREKYWNDFMVHLNASDQRTDKDERLNCKLDRDLADSLDDCDIGNRCRSDLVNAIIRTFFDTFLPRLVQYRRERKSLFQNYTHA